MDKKKRKNKDLYIWSDNKLPVIQRKFRQSGENAEKRRV
jgi:hypothetical protein